MLNRGTEETLPCQSAKVGVAEELSNPPISFHTVVSACLNILKCVFTDNRLQSLLAPEIYHGSWKYVTQIHRNSQKL